MNQAVKGTFDTTVRPEVTPFFDEPTNTLSYVVKDPASKACAVVDCVMDLDYPSGSISFAGADQIIAYIRDKRLELQWILETHV
ncbi:MAG: MBL fold metallo-hydrolase, partial [Proteobacteria bacterium]|nr:MBL fold metallo-hydrolase [Pseudomonadota bacterium]